MNSSWQLKCGSALQSSMPTMASSTSQEAQDQTEISSAHYFYSQAGQDLRFHMHGRMPDSTVPSITNITSCSSTPSDLSSSFLGLLSGPASLLQFDFQELPNPKLFNASSKLANEIGSVAVSPYGRQVPLTSGRLPSENMSYQNLRIGDDLYPIVSSRAEGCSNSGGSSVFQNCQPAANISLQGSDLAKTAVHHNVNGNEKVKDFHSLREERHSMSLINGVKLQNADNQMLKKLPLEVKYSVCNNSSIFTSGCPRVLCLDRSGDLLLSNTGLLGILCSCHCFHMSVSRFCEHSGLYNVNPGDAVHMESGETISQWRKLNFQKFGIRIPEDQSGWDWPEGLSLTASLMKSGVSMSNMLKNSDCSNLVGPSGDLLRSRWPLGDVSSKNFPVNKNLVSDDLHDKQHINGQDGNKVYHKGLLGTSKRNSCDVGDKHVTACSISRCSTMPKFAYGGPESICQSIYIDTLATTHPTVQNQRALIKNSDVSRGEDVQDFTLIDKIASSSSIELKLGQPYQKIHSPGKPVLPVIGPQSYNTILNSQKQFSQEQIIHNVISCKAEEESRHYLPCAVGLSNFTVRREQDHLNHTNCAINNTLDAAKLEQLKGNMAVSLFKHCTLSEGSSQSRATDDLHNVSEHVIPKTQHCESHAVKCDINAPRNASNHLDKRNMIPELSISKLVDKGKGEGCLGGNSYVQTASGSKLLKWMENTKSFTGVVHGNNISVFPPMHDGSHYSHCSSNMPPYASDAGNSTNCLENVPFSGSSGHIDHVFLSSMGSSRDYKQNLASQGVSIGSTSSTSNLSPGFLAAMTNQDCSGISPCLFDDNLRLLALGQMLELSKQHVVSSLGKPLEEGKCNNSSNVKMRHSFVEPSTFEEQRHAPNLIRREDISEIAMKMKSDLSDPPCKMASNVEKFTSVTGFNRWCNYPTLKQGMPAQCQEFGTHYQLSDNPLYNERSLLRLNGSQSINCPNGHESCCQKTFYFQCNCSCVGHTKCLLGNCNARAGNPSTSSREQTGSVSCKTPVPIASQFAKDHAIPKENVVSFDQCGTIRGQLPRNVFCSGSQWKDVPSKVKKVCELAYVKQSADALNERNELFQLEDSAAKHSKGAVHGADSFKKQDMSNISSGCSTEASIEATDLDSSTIVGNTGYANNIIVDEGSGIDKCWSSDDAIESHRDFYGFTGESYLRRQKSCKVVGYKSARSLLDEVKLMDSLAWKKGQNRKHIGITVHGKSNKLQESDKSFKSGKRKREMKMKTLDSLSGTAVPLLHGKSSECDDTSDWHCLSKNVQMVSSGPESSWASGAHSIKINQKHGNSKLTVTKTLAGKRDVLQCYDAGDGEDDHETEINRDSSSKNLGISGRKKLRSNQTAVICMQFQIQESTQAVGEKTEMYNSENFTKTSSQQVNLCDRKPKPVVCGKYGEIINRNMTGDVLEPVKIVSLDRVLKTAKRCSLSKSYKAGLTSSKELKGTNFSWSNACFEKSSSLTKEIEMRCNDASVCEEMDIHISMEERDNMFASGNELYVDEFLMVGKKDQRSEEGHTIQDTTAHPCSRPKHKDRKRSLYELTLRGKNPGPKMISQKKIFKCAPKIHWENILKNTDESHHQKSREVKRCIREQKDLPITDIDLFCCVCGSSNKDEVNCLLECDQCSIRVHQTCYGVSKVPKGNWYCRPCRTNSKNIVCVLCGYGGGAMTRAFRSCTLVKSLLKAWNLESERKPKNAISSGDLQDEQSMLHSSGSIPENNSYPVLRPISSEPSTSTVCNMDTQNQFAIQNPLCLLSDVKVHNSIIAGVLDSTVKQWVHVVCGLWTPGTRCPNVDTMSAFDVSAVPYPRANVVCSLCNRNGGPCIQCRVANCSVRFHPWCAHQKGLLQSEAEGVNDENVGFYGRCERHATYPTNISSCYATNVEADHSGEKEASCARTEGYKGRKRDGFWHNINIQSKGKGGCLVPQEQVNAWIHINGQKSCAHGLLKLPMSEKEYDCRKEYTRYRQAKGWKHLVVYKSGIHALGLYTSRFISRGEMVVEYVGEIVGLRVADKRENEYQYGRRLQYKSACYFFRIDKEHIIDATCKGGIARFVNHSCRPNCVAKVISVRNEKKVVFLAERDIYPGEEITYDYHFNHEDEGKKIPCFCDAKNCRRYLN